MQVSGRRRLSWDGEVKGRGGTAQDLYGGYTTEMCVQGWGFSGRAGGLAVPVADGDGYYPGIWGAGEPVAVGSGVLHSDDASRASISLATSRSSRVKPSQVSQPSQAWSWLMGIHQLFTQQVWWSWTRWSIAPSKCKSWIKQPKNTPSPNGSASVVTKLCPGEPQTIHILDVSLIWLEFLLTNWYFSLGQWCPMIILLEGQCPAELAPTHLPGSFDWSWRLWLAGSGVLLKLKLNSEGQWPSRSRIGTTG